MSFKEVLFEKNLENPNFREEDSVLEITLRPKILKDYVGQKKIKDNLNIYIEAAKKRNEALDHVLLYGPPGLGKTTLAMVIANELGVNVKITSGPAIEKAGDLAAILSSLEENDVLFIDEIHRLSKQVEEVLYPAMEDGVIDILIGKGPSARSIRLNLPKFTLIGATTKVGQLSAPLRGRFLIVFRLELYSSKELKEIILKSSNILKVSCEPSGAYELGKRSRGTPRIANRLLKRCRDFAEILGDGKINLEIVNITLERLLIDKIGLEALDIKLLKTIIEYYGGGPVGLETVAALLCEEAVTIEDVYEPYLMRLGFLSRTQRGRCVTLKAYEYLGIEKDSNCKE